MNNFICKKCGSTEYEIKDKANGTGIAHGLYCAKCGFWHKWLGKEELKQYKQEERKETNENKAEKSLRWVVNQIPDFKPTTNEEKMLVAIKIYSEAGAEEIRRLEAENAALRARLEKAVELPPGDRVWYIAEDEEGAESYIISKPTSSLAVEELKYEIGKKYFTTREAAEKRAELNGGKQ